MTNSMLPADGGCMCGVIRMRISASPVMTMACHCAGCQKLSASAFSLTAMFASESLEVVAGEPVVGALRGPSAYVFCPNCLNWLFTRPAGMDMFVNVRPTMFGIAAWSTPFIETCTCEKLPWAATPAQHSFERFPPAEQYASLMAAFAEQRSSF